MLVNYRHQAVDELGSEDCYEVSKPLPEADALNMTALQLN